MDAPPPRAAWMCRRPGALSCAAFSVALSCAFVVASTIAPAALLARSVDWAQNLGNVAGPGTPGTPGFMDSDLGPLQARLDVSAAGRVGLGLEEGGPREQ